MSACAGQKSLWSSAVQQSYIDLCCVMLPYSWEVRTLLSTGACFLAEVLQEVIKLMETSASGKGSNASSLESSVWMSSCWNWAKKISLYRQRAVLLTYFAVKAHSEELAVIWRSPENSSTSTTLIKTLGSCGDYNNQTYRHVTNNRTWYHYKEQEVPSVGQGVSANCTGCSQWHVQGWCSKGGGGRHTVAVSQKDSSS